MSKAKHTQELVNMIIPATLSGRCANGYERGQGHVIHAIKCSDNELRFGINYGKHSLCGKTHGARSAGWSHRLDLVITCKKCLAQIKNIGERV